MRQSFWWYLLMDLWFENDLFLGHFPFESKRNCFNFIFYFVKLQQMLFFMIIFRNTDMLTTLCLKTPFWWKDFWTIGGKLGGRFVITVDSMLFVHVSSFRNVGSLFWIVFLVKYIPVKKSILLFGNHSLRIFSLVPFCLVWYLFQRYLFSFFWKSFSLVYNFLI